MGLFDLLNDAVMSAFGDVTAAIRRADTSVIPVSGIFDRRHLTIEAGGEVSFSGMASTLSVRVADIPGVARMDRVTVPAGVFLISDLQPDGQGMTVLVLEAM
jgi:hypothetical protein